MVFRSRRSCEHATRRGNASSSETRVSRVFAKQLSSSFKEKEEEEDDEEEEEEEEEENAHCWR